MCGRHAELKVRRLYSAAVDCDHVTNPIRKTNLLLILLLCSLYERVTLCTTVKHIT